MPQQYKIDKVKELTELVKSKQNFVVTDYRGLSVSKISKLRGMLREKSIEYSVVKNNLFKIALKDVNIEGVDELIVGPTAIAFHESDVVSTAKVLTEFNKEAKEFKIKGGYADGEILSKEDIKVYSTLPSMEEIIGKIAGGLVNPLVKINNGLNSPVRQLAILLNELASGKGENIKLRAE